MEQPLRPSSKTELVSEISQFSSHGGSRESLADSEYTNGSIKIGKRDRQCAKRNMRRRLVYKTGECNISHTNIKKRRRRFLADIFTTLIDSKWRWCLLLFMMAFMSSWMLFAVIWWIICFAHGDLENFGNPDWQPCVNEVGSFTTALLFSIETQHTIGYGSRSTSEYCPEAVFVMMMQSCCGVIIQALMTGLVFAKIARPKKRAETLMFSKNAVICKRNGVLCLLFRVGDMRKSHVIEAHVRGAVVKKQVTKEGEVIPLAQMDVNFGFDDGRDRLFLVWPVIVEHRIDEDSPFWKMSLEDLYREQFEFIIIFEGIVESTGMTAQARSSYLPGEILWGHRFERLITYQKENGEYEIDYSRFHATTPVDTPTCSAKELHDIEGSSSSGSSDDDNPSKPMLNDDNSSITSKLEKDNKTYKNFKFSPFMMKKHGGVQAELDEKETIRNQKNTSVPVKDIQTQPPDMKMFTVGKADS